MKKMILLGWMLIPAFVQAQKLPNVQQGGMHAVADIKIDGKPGEWGNQFKAYNKATEILYTMANDRETLYLVVQASYHDVVDKILRGGLTLTINHTLKKGDKTPVIITYPVLRDASMADVSNMFARKSNDQREAKGAAILPNDLNAILQEKSKEITIGGIKTISEPAISVYNDEGIKAVALFNGELAYTYELAIPLKYLDLPNGGTDGFSYQIKVNEPAELKHAAGGPPPPPMMMTQLSTTDFWGEYTLVK